MALILIISFEGEPIQHCKREEAAQPPADGLSNSICSRSARGRAERTCHHSQAAVSNLAACSPREASGARRPGEPMSDR